MRQLHISKMDAQVWGKSESKKEAYAFLSKPINCFNERLGQDLIAVNAVFYRIVSILPCKIWARVICAAYPQLRKDNILLIFGLS